MLEIREFPASIRFGIVGKKKQHPLKDNNTKYEIYSIGMITEEVSACMRDVSC